MMNAVNRWFWADAEWWQFWKPGSGPVGGIVMSIPTGVLIALVAELIRKLA